MRAQPGAPYGSYALDRHSATVYPLLVTALEFDASIMNSLAWPAVVLAAVVLLRRELAGAFRRLQSFEFRGGKATFAALEEVEKVVAVTTKSESSPNDGAGVRAEDTEFSALTELAKVAPAQAIINAWGLLEYQLNVASDRIAPDQPHGWPQVADSLANWDKWPLLYPAVWELRRLRDYTVQSSRPPSSSDAIRYVSVAQDLVAALRASPVSISDGGTGGEA